MANILFTIHNLTYMQALFNSHEFLYFSMLRSGLIHDTEALEQRTTPYALCPDTIRFYEDKTARLRYEIEITRYWYLIALIQVRECPEYPLAKEEARRSAVGRAWWADSFA